MTTSERLRAALKRAALGRRRILTPPRTGNQEGPPCVYFLTPDYDIPAGGVRVIYRHVDLLNQAGVRAAVVHQRSGFRCSWFANETEIRGVRDTVLGPGDLLVVGELDVGSLVSFDSHVPHVIFNQNTFNTWAGDHADVLQYYRHGPTPRAMLTVSDYAREFLRDAFPGVEVIRLHLQIDAQFHDLPGPRPPVISYMLRKGVGELAKQVENLVASSGSAQDWIFRPVAGVSLEEVARRLRQSRIFLSLAESEGFGLPAAEAMACGNYVVGSHGQGGREFFDPRFCAVTEARDVVGMARAIRHAIELEQAQPGWLREKATQGSRHVLSTYSAEAETREVVKAYRTLMDVTE